MTVHYLEITCRERFILHINLNIFRQNKQRHSHIRKVWKYQRRNQNPQIEEGHTTQWPKDEGQTTQWPKEKGQNNNLQNTAENWRSSNTNPTKNWMWTRVFRKGSSSCSTSGNRINISYTYEIKRLENHFIQYLYIQNINKYTCEHRRWLLATVHNTTNVK